MIWQKHSPKILGNEDQIENKICPHVPLNMIKQWKEVCFALMLEQLLYVLFGAIIWAASPIAY